MDQLAFLEFRIQTKYVLYFFRTEKRNIANLFYNVYDLGVVLPPLDKNGTTSIFEQATHSAIDSTTMYDNNLVVLN